MSSELTQYRALLADVRELKADLEAMAVNRPAAVAEAFFDAADMTKFVLEKEAARHASAARKFH